ncbi:MAG: peptidase M75 superfamily protein [Flavobacteriales bacterium]|mgnify:CR=1 FL=1|nr:peptidase M75 superfamily protein [Flavobacteriales bacterium]|tara:strand:+ start:2108 stop:3205 length:1098 start_codon:yes stop_codon:yes gene_type:complete
MKKIIYLFTISILLFSCDTENNDNDLFGDGYDRQSILLNWADNIITPAYENFNISLSDLHQSVEEFVSNPNESNLIKVSADWLTAYMKWQYIEMFDFGYAETINYKNKMNVYPADADFIDVNITSEILDLNNNSYNDARGFPALDYMIHGLAEDVSSIVSLYQNDERYINYLVAIIDNMIYNTNLVIDAWSDSKNDFIDSNGNTATSSLNIMTNDFIFFFEKGFRANKFGIPAGVFSSNPIPNSVEAFYKKDVSKQLALEALQACEDFFIGKHIDSEISGPSFSSYLNYLPGSSDSNLSNDILSQFSTSRTQINSLDNNFFNQIETNNIEMLYAYDAIQLLVVYFKVDMLQSLAVSVDYVDADGD